MALEIKIRFEDSQVIHNAKHQATIAFIFLALVSAKASSGDFNGLFVDGTASPTSATVDQGVSPIYLNKSEFLSAAERGEYFDVNWMASYNSVERHITNKKISPILSTITNVLENDYRVPSIYSELNSVGYSDPQRCPDAYKNHVALFMAAVTNMYHMMQTTRESGYLVALGDGKQIDAGVRTQVALLSQPLEFCRFYDVDKGYRGLSFQKPFISLMNEYGLATKKYVDAINAQNRQNYVEEVARLKVEREAADRDLAERQEAQRRQQEEKVRQEREIEDARVKAEQERIDNEAKKIRMQEELLREKERRRVGG